MLLAFRSLSDPFALWDIALWCICILVLLIFNIITMYKITLNRGPASDLQRRNALTWAVAFMLLGIANLLNLIWRYMIDDSFMRMVVDNLSVLCVNLALSVV